MESSNYVLAQHAIRGEHIRKVYGSGDNSVVALAGIDIAIQRAQFTAIMGPSGSGKSTLMHCMAGLDSLDSGSVRIGDTEISALDDNDLTRFRREHVGFIFQSFNLLPAFSAKDNMLMPSRLAGRKGVDSAWFDHLVDALALSDRLRHRPAELSGGQQQRVAIARALLHRPQVIFADEPTGNLDSTTGQNVLRFLQACVREHSQTLVMVTHDPLAAAYADRVVLLNDGMVAGELSDPTPGSVLQAIQKLGG